ncbi:hypothetical protein M4951_18915 [Blastopirellula sp. J2-11]|uniref:hypothetical protein n=1 Tax=Blastopirellula sp. J2-11 TaxID=2943192 RepID=UPI0021CA2C77|nr:hypothetical protein [Blastopirellula sp. J2-11]UUO05440.1 hypothetical protein M4951_18915 [Blastopirellula sp. J2-11]
MSNSSFPWTLSPELSIEFRYANEATHHGSRIGGAPPKLAIPQFESPYQKFFATLEFDTGFAVSIFYSFEIFGESEDRDVLKFHSDALEPSALIHAVVHEISPADKLSPIPSEVTCHRLQIGEPAADLFQREFEPDEHFHSQLSYAMARHPIPIPESKVGGGPYTENRPLAAESFAALDSRGYRQMAQFASPDGDEIRFVEGFPWDPGMLHLFVKGDAPSSLEFAFVVQY